MDPELKSTAEEEDEEKLELSAATLAALQEFYAEQKASQPVSVEETDQEKIFDEYDKYIQAFPEDWRLSQFWYDEETSNKLAKEVIRVAEESNGRVACISCPSVFRACRGSDKVDLYEYDTRFEVFGNKYFFYDYNTPENLPEACLKAYSVIILDPPVLALECLQKVALTVGRLGMDSVKILLCTGAVMEKEAFNLLSLVKTSFIPKHKKNLGNEFCCYTNYKLELT